MSKITCLKELNKRKYLELDDIVKFTINEKIIEYTVQIDYLLNNNINYDNDEIFKILELDKNKMAEKAYGYKPTNSTSNIFHWPEVDNDLPALTRLVKELYKAIEERKPKYTKYNRFEIIDI